MLRLFVVSLIAAALAACGSTSKKPDAGGGGGGGGAGGGTGGGMMMPVDSGTPDAGLDAGFDAGIVDSGFPEAAHADGPYAESYGGPVAANPKLVPIVFPNDPLEPDIETFLAAFAHTTYWGDRVAEYGIAPPVMMPTFHATEVQPASIDTDALNAWLNTNLSNGSGLPQPDANTMYVFFTPPGTTVTLFGETSCQQFHGFHDESTFDGGAFSYAVVTRCDTLPEIPVTGVQYISAVASHEILEGLADPFPETNPAFGTTDADHEGWVMAVGGEIGDLCALVGDAFYTPDDFPYTVQRIWSNAAAAAGRDPCAPEPSGEPYFNTAPLPSEDVTFSYQGQSYPTKGVLVPLGQERDIELDLYSDGETSGPWTVQALEYSSNPTHVQLTLDKSSGTNGDKLNLHIKPLSKDPQWGSELVVILSKLGTRRNLWFLVVGN